MTIIGRLLEINVKVDLSKFDIKSDTGWVYNKLTSKPHKGLEDYDRVVEFNNIAKVDLKEVVIEVSKDKPGWTDVSYRPQDKLTPNVIRFMCTQDSSG